jgi:hypothetical protein
MNSKVVRSDGLGESVSAISVEKITRNNKQFFPRYLVLYRLPLCSLLLVVLGVLLLVV